MYRHKFVCNLCSQSYSLKTELFIHKLSAHETLEEFCIDRTAKNGFQIVDILQASTGQFDYILKLEVDRVPKIGANADKEEYIFDFPEIEINKRINENSLAEPSEMKCTSDPSTNTNLSKITDRTVEYQCYLCKQICSNLAGLLAHCGRTHVAAKKKSIRKFKAHRCNHCDTIFNSNVQLMRHWETLKNGKSSLCTVCFATFDKKYDLIVHKAMSGACSVSKFLCYHCGKYYGNNTLLKYHLVSVHSDVKSFTCRFCSKTFSTKGGLDRHEAAHENKRQFVCNVNGCGRNFNNTGMLREHTRFIHEAPKQKCSYCGKIFKRPVTLREHIRLHTGEKPFHCDICDKRFTLRGTLSSHIRMHFNDKRYKCEICEMKFRDTWHLKRHQNRSKCSSKSSVTQ